MREQIHCNIVKDLLPSYVDELVSKETKELVEGHISNCASCKDYLQEMKEGQNIPEKSVQMQAVDYMAKIRRYEKRLLLSGLVISFLLGAALYMVVLCLPQMIYLIRGEGISDYVVKRLEVIWWVAVLRIITAGSLGAVLYMLVQVFQAKGALWKSDRFAKKLLYQCTAFFVFSALVFVFRLPILMVAGVVAAAAVGIGYRV